MTNDFITENYEVLSKVCSAQEIIGAVLHMIIPVVELDSPKTSGFSSALRWTFVPFFDDPNEGLAFGEHMSRRCEIGLFGEWPDDLTRCGA